MSTEFIVPDMTCGHCVKTITSAVQAVAPAAQVTADLASHRVAIEGADAQRAREAIEDAGYEVQVA
ncbi:heavy-metal-associated domain-containing protein [Bordetella sp. FB-8]|uniref:heavy-metal-associated domain-containing protein n=1 Tax=Bordetella sp. FB-8 TaxID=1159870 RepID=UPI00037EBF5A|nr:heavy-metal-associated domain-containing protein [Bordetella sp. FB-8]